MDTKVRNREGSIELWSPAKKFGIIVSKNGSIYEKFFLVLINVDSCQLSEPVVGCKARFNISARPPKRQGDFPYAVDVEITGVHS